MVGWRFHWVMGNFLSPKTMRRQRAALRSPLLKLAKAPHCDLLKLDCEGIKYGILCHLNTEQVGRFQPILYEATPSLYDAGALNDNLRPLGYVVEPQKDLFHATRGTALLSSENRADRTGMR